MAIIKGTVKWFNEQKGYGFIAPEDGTGEIFVHYTSFPSGGFKSLDEGDVVHFEIVPSNKGPKAHNVIKA